MIGHTTRGAKALALLAIVAVTASCGLPRPGPNKKEIFAGSVLRGGDAFIVSVNSRVTRATAVMPSFGFTDAFQKAGKLGSDTIAAGDVLAVTVYENVRDDPLLGNTGQRVSQLTEVQVDGQGFIFIPYAGRIKAAGNSVEAVRASITRKLDAQTPDPQVQVARVAGDGSTVTINGSVATPGVFPIEQPTRTLAAMLARAGGVAIEPATALVRVTRGGETGKIWLKDLWANPAMDIALRPGDRIVIEEDERKFTALGATGAQTVVPFASESLSAIEALATVGGLQTMAADPTGVFVFRNEPAAIANAVLGRSDLSGDQRVVYVLDLTAPTGMFEARDFLIRDGDTVYVTEAPYVQWNKTLSVLTGSAGAAASLNSAAGN
ncbi:polysaccharide export protein [Xinfangfangia sp. D13-10-4-6]|uniref:polysaccharide biosynthesis/export family protein n=1 Tax=Pseudogemmobacter hezensis TaxID=2737662 RepID=UPI001553F042|nr:polysaccharide export protein [Pseudogemmobacter hezensis]